MILIDYRDKRPIYEQVIERFETLILSGGLEPDSQLPSVRQLAVELALNPNTVQRAYAELERMGYICSVKGRGSFVQGEKSLERKKREYLHHILKDSVRSCRMAGMSVDDIREEMEQILKEEQGV